MTMAMTTEKRQILLNEALRSIQYGLETRRILKVNIEDYPENLREIRSSFVTLEKFHELRGCIGKLEAVDPLIADVIENSFLAAFRDPRFPSVKADEVKDLDIQISILEPASPLSFTSQSDLLAQLKPGVDGLILEEGRRRSTFLPAVWENISKPKDFLEHLKLKAGLPPEYWSSTLKVFRYSTDSFSRKDI